MNGDTIDDGRSARRPFLTRLSAVVVGGIVTVFPFAAGWGVFSDPLRRRRAASDDGNESLDAGLVRICPLETLPADGLPHAFPVTSEAVDAWTRAPNQRIGEVFLTRSDVNGKPNVLAFTATCPHLGCAVEFNAAEDRYECPCHESAFAKDGKQLFGPSRRGLDPLDVKIGDKEPREIMVKFQRFRAGVPERESVG
jgi:nitrite reductase/ring-hydroxylating ferredoxin subunit